TPARLHDAVERDRISNPLEPLRPELRDHKVAADQSERCTADHHVSGAALDVRGAVHAVAEDVGASPASPITVRPVWIPTRTRRMRAEDIAGSRAAAFACNTGDSRDPDGHQARDTAQPGLAALPWCCQARTPSVTRSWKLAERTASSMPQSRMRSRTGSRTRAKANVIPRLCISVMVLNNASQAVVSMKFTESASTSTRLTGGWLAATAARRLSRRCPMLPKTRSPPGRHISSPGKVRASGWRRMSR